MPPTPRPYPAYKPSGVPWLGDVPEHWEVQRLKHHLVLNDSGVWGDDLDESGIIVLRSTEQTIDGSWRITNPAKIRLPETVIASALLQANDLVVTKSSGSSDHIGKTSIVSKDIAEMNCCFSNFLQRIRLDSYLMPMLVWYILNSRIGREQIIAQSTTSTGLGNLNGKIIGSCDMPLPPLTEQAAIVRFLDHADRRIRRYLGAKQKLITLLLEEKQAIISQAVTRGLDPNVPLKPSGVEWLGDVPAHWEVRRLKRVLSSLIDCEHKTAPAVDVSSYRVVRTSAVRGGTLLLSGTYCTSKEAFAEWTRRGSLEPGDVIFTREAPAGEACVVPSSLNLCLGQRTVLMKVDRHAYEPQFLVHMLYTGPPHDEIELASQGSTLPHFNVEDIGTLPVLAPPVLEQRAIVDWLEAETGDLTYAIGRARRQIELLREYRTRLIADVVTGKLDVRAAAAQLPEQPDDQEPVDEGDPTEDMDGGLEEADDAADEAVV